MITLEQVDQVKDRTGVSYKAAKEALEATGGDVLEAIIHLEQGEACEEGPAGHFGKDVIAGIKDIIKKGNVTKIYFEKDDKTIVDVPVTAGAIGAFLFAPAVIAAIIAAVATGCEMKIVKEDGEVINVKNVTKETLENVKDKLHMGGKNQDQPESPSEEGQGPSEEEDQE